jgi:hypothetical protein
MASILRRNRERELLDFARSYLAEAFPNAERKDCPSDDALRQFAFQPLSTQPAAGDESLTSHLGYCSPCFNAYMAHLREAESGPARSSFGQRLASVPRLRLVFAAAAVLATIFSVLLVRRRPSITVVQPAPIAMPMASPPARTLAAYVPLVIDLSKQSPVRALEHVSHRPAPVSVGSRLQLTIRLPLGSEEGIYAVRVRSPSRIFWSKSVPAHREGGQTLLHTQADLSRLDSGSYDLEVHSRALDLSVPILLSVLREGH